MKDITSNAGYFARETMTMIRQGLLSNTLSIVSMFLIFFILAMAISGWRISNHVADVIQGQAEINVFYQENMENDQLRQLIETINNIQGVKEASLVDKNEAYARMAEILGDQANILKIFTENPFSPFIEVTINLDKLDPVVNELNNLTGIDHVQNNKEVLDRLRTITGTIRLFGILIVLAVGISTLVIISQIIRLGIQNNSEQINTLRLLGAPETFIALPFLLEGLLLTVSGGILAVVLTARTLRHAYAGVAGQLSFIPLLPLNTVIYSEAAGVIILSIVLGIGGGLVGLATAKRK
jgi:cell division transport system permease protein